MLEMLVVLNGLLWALLGLWWLRDQLRPVAVASYTVIRVGRWSAVLNVHSGRRAGSLHVALA